MSVYGALAAQAWQPKFDLKDPHLKKKKERTKYTQLSSDLYIDACYIQIHIHPDHTHT